VLKKLQKIIPVPSPSPLLLLLLPVTPAEPTSADKGEDKNIKEPIEVGDKGIGSLLLPLPPPIYFISV